MCRRDLTLALALEALTFEPWPREMRNKDCSGWCGAQGLGLREALGFGDQDLGHLRLGPEWWFNLHAHRLCGLAEQARLSHKR